MQDILSWPCLYFQRIMVSTISFRGGIGNLEREDRRQLGARKWCTGNVALAWTNVSHLVCQSPFLQDSSGAIDRCQFRTNSKSLWGIIRLVSQQPGMVQSSSRSSKCAWIIRPLAQFVSGRRLLVYCHDADAWTLCQP